MIEFIKWFWVSINFRAWTFEGQKLANPLLIIIRLIMIIPIYFVAGILCLMLLITFNKGTAKDIWNMARF